MRKQLVSPPPEVKPQQVEGIITQVREYKLITPLFGGGVTPGETDPVTIIRGTEIRGQLRFWWRACRGGSYQTVKSLKKAEDEIWGAASKKQAEDKNVEDISKEKEETTLKKATVQIAVETISEGMAVEPFYKITENGRTKVVPNKDEIAPPYAAFPLQPDTKKNELLKKVQNDVTFTLTISFPDSKRTEIEAALWAWETFGGVGARTRRGFGALKCIDIIENDKSLSINLPEPNEEQAQKWLYKNLQAHVIHGSWPKGVPHLERQPREGKIFKLIAHKGNDNEKVLDIWYDLINTFKRFRQIRYTSKKYNAKHPGRSMWSEPSAIRHYTDQSHPYHKNPIPKLLIKKFPRAAFGLPIIFQFKDSNKERPPNPDDPQSDPRKTVLQLEAYERFASPLILKPLACQEDDTMGLAIILTGTDLDGKQLVLQTQEGKQQEWPVEATLSSGETLELVDEKGKKIKLDSRTDVLQAFIEYL